MARALRAPWRWLALRGAVCPRGRGQPKCVQCIVRAALRAALGPHAGWVI